MTTEHNEKKTQVQDYFSRTAESYVASISHSTGFDLKRLIELGEWEAQQQALDLATGGGHTALAVAPHVAQVTVTDLTPRMLETARAFLSTQGVTNAHFQLADAEDLPFAASSFDRVTCRIAPHHFPDAARAIKEVARVLKPDGLFLVIDSMAPATPEIDVFYNTIEKWRDPSHGRSYTMKEWESFFKDAGLRIEHTETFRKQHSYDDWTTRSQLPTSEKDTLERFILESNTRIQRYFEISLRPDGHLDNLSFSYLILKGRKGA